MLLFDPTESCILLACYDPSNVYHGQILRGNDQDPSDDNWDGDSLHRTLPSKKSANYPSQQPAEKSAEIRQTSDPTFLVRIRRQAEPSVLFHRGQRLRGVGIGASDAETSAASDQRSQIQSAGFRWFLLICEM